MWKAIFLAVGISLCVVGAECLVVEQATMIGNAPNSDAASLEANSPKILTPPEWAPWSLMSAGAVVVLYSFTIPKRVSGE